MPMKRRRKIYLSPEAASVLSDMSFTNREHMHRFMGSIIPDEPPCALVLKMTEPGYEHLVAYAGPYRVTFQYSERYPIDAEIASSDVTIISINLKTDTNHGS
jgi:hypothetical protein